jgi:hypothetical protein
MAEIPDTFELVVKGKAVTVVTRATNEQINFTGVNLSSDQAASLARLINLNDGETDLHVEVRVNT